MKPDDPKIRDFIGAMQFLASAWNVETHYEIDVETGRVDLQVWQQGSVAVLHVDGAPLGRIMIVPPDGRFSKTNCPPTPPSVETSGNPDKKNSDLP